eukprot:12909240-Ditylum_brightwellii.AAC.1
MQFNPTEYEEDKGSQVINDEGKKRALILGLRKQNTKILGFVEEEEALEEQNHPLTAHLGTILTPVEALLGDNHVTTPHNTDKVNTEVCQKLEPCCLVCKLITKNMDWDPQHLIKTLLLLALQ